MDGGVVQVVPVSCCLGKEGVSHLVCAASWNHEGPIAVSHVVTNSVCCDVSRLSLGSNESTRFLLSQTFIGRQSRYPASGSYPSRLNHP